MNIEFQRVVPNYLKEEKFSEISIWSRNFNISPTEKVLLKAISGKGKTTFTHILSGIKKEYSGNILFDNQNISTLNKDDWSKIRQQKLSFIFQDLQLFESLTVEENILLKNNLTNHYTLEEILSFFERLQIQQLWNRKLNTLSLGQQQRIAIIRALCQPFDFLMMDEPFSHLDKKNSALAFELINDVCQQKKAGFVLTSLDEHKDFLFDKTLTI